MVGAVATSRFSLADFWKFILLTQVVPAALQDAVFGPETHLPQHPQACLPLVALADVQAAQAELCGPRLQSFAAQKSALILLHSRKIARAGITLVIRESRLWDENVALIAL